MEIKEIVERNVCKHIDGIITEESTVFGQNSPLDSMGLVSLLVDIEQDIYDNLKVEVTIASDRAMSQERSPFRTVKSLTNFIEVLIENSDYGN